MEIMHIRLDSETAKNIRILAATLELNHGEIVAQAIALLEESMKKRTI